MLDPDEIKHKLRKLKRLEINLRSAGNNQRRLSPVWDKFFDLREKGEITAKYTLSMLTSMCRDDYKKIINDYLSFLYNEIYIKPYTHDYTANKTDALIHMDLQYDAGITEIKRRFHELAKIYHPDAGGDAEKIYRTHGVI